MQQQCSAAEAVRSYADVCRRRAQDLRTSAAGWFQHGQVSVSSGEHFYASCRAGRHEALDRVLVLA